MMPNVFRTKVETLYTLVRVQRGARVFVRSLWAAGAGYLLGWGLHALWDWLPDARHWYLLGLGLALFSMIDMLKIASKEQFLWNLDRRFGLREQISGAWVVARDELEGELAAELLTESGALLEEQQARIVEKGWDVGKELHSLLIVLVLLGMVYLSGVSLLPDLPAAGRINLPGLGSDPNAAGIFPSGIPGISEQEAQDMGLDYNSESQQGGDGGMTPDELGQVGDVLSDLGQDLSQQAATADLGDALQQGDLERAADELERLAANLDDISQDTRDNLADSLADAADQLDQPGQQDLSDALEGAANAAENPDTAGSDQLDNLAEQLRAIAQQAAQDPNSQTGAETSAQDGAVQEGDSAGGGTGGAGSGTTDPDSGEAQPFERLQGEGETFNLGDFDDQNGYLLLGDPGEVNADSSIGGVYDFTGAGDATIISGNYDPYNYPWNQRDVISNYFTP